MTRIAARDYVEKQTYEKDMSMAYHLSLIHILSLSISYRIFIKFFLEVGGFSLPLLPCSLNLVCFLQISMTASTQLSLIHI